VLRASLALWAAAWRAATELLLLLLLLLVLLVLLLRRRRWRHGTGRRRRHVLLLLRRRRHGRVVLLLLRLLWRHGTGHVGRVRVVVVQLRLLRRVEHGRRRARHVGHVRRLLRLHRLVVRMVTHHVVLCRLRWSRGVLGISHDGRGEGGRTTRETSETHTERREGARARDRESVCAREGRQRQRGNTKRDTQQAGRTAGYCHLPRLIRQPTGMRATTPCSLPKARCPPNHAARRAADMAHTSREGAAAVSNHGLGGGRARDGVVGWR